MEMKLKKFNLNKAHELLKSWCGDNYDAKDEIWIETNRRGDWLGCYVSPTEYNGGLWNTRASVFRLTQPDKDFIELSEG